MIKKSISTEGVLLWWDSAEVQRDALLGALKGAGFVDLMPLFDPVACIKRVCNEVVEACDMKVRGCPIDYRPLRKDVIGAQAVREIKGEKQNQYDFLFSMVAQGQNLDELTVSFAKIDPAAAPEVQADMQKLETLARTWWLTYRDWIPAKDLTDAMRRLVFRLKGTMPKKSGGLYFIPDEHVGTFEQVAKAIESSETEASFTTGIVDLSSNPRMFKRVMEGLEAEIMDETGKMQSEIEALATNSKRMRRNGIERRLQDICDWTDKVEYYEKLMGIAMPKLRDAIGEAKYAIGVHGLEALGAAE